MFRKFKPPAGISDFDENSSLRDAWDEFISKRFDDEISGLSENDKYHKDNVSPDKVLFFDPRKQPPGQLNEAHVTWFGFPNILKAIYQDEKKAFQLADNLATFGKKNDTESTYPSRYFSDPQGNNSIPFDYRQQDEYVEWVIHRDNATKKIKEIIFTCEGPEYWEVLANDKQLLLQLYRKYASQEVLLSDLLFSDDVYAFDSNENKFVNVKGQYNWYNKWNLAAAIHLTHPANTLGAEINLAARASVLRENGGTSLKDAHALICCAGYGDANRNSDPKIGSAVNSEVRGGNWVSLRDPVGLYMSEIDSSSFTKPDGSSILDFQDRYWNVLRSSKDGSMILRASVKVPEDEVFDGKPFLLGDLLVKGDPLRHGGQIADAITVGLYAITIPGAPKATPVKCQRKCCQNPDHPNVDDIVEIDTPCKSDKHRSTLMIKMSQPYNRFRR